MLMRILPWARLPEMKTGRALTLIVTLALGILAAPITSGAQQAARTSRIGPNHPTTPVDHKSRESRNH